VYVIELDLKGNLKIFSIIQASIQVLNMIFEHDMLLSPILAPNLGHFCIPSRDYQHQPLSILFALLSLNGQH